MTKVHYFEQDEADSDDTALKMAIRQGAVPATCLLGGKVALGLYMAGQDPCKGCKGPRLKCHSRATVTTDADREAVQKESI